MNTLSSCIASMVLVYWFKHLCGSYVVGTWCDPGPLDNCLDEHHIIQCDKAIISRPARLLYKLHVAN